MRSLKRFKLSFSGTQEELLLLSNKGSLKNICDSLSLRRSSRLVSGWKRAVTALLIDAVEARANCQDLFSYLVRTKNQLASWND